MIYIRLFVITIARSIDLTSCELSHTCYTNGLASKKSIITSLTKIATVESE